nr:hypothetical protein [Cylindrospermopsis raciborskii]
MWVIEGNILSDQEVEYFTNLPREYMLGGIPLLI